MTSQTLSAEIRHQVAAGDLNEALVVAMSATVSYPTSKFFAERLALISYDLGELATCRSALSRARRLGSDARALLLIEPLLLIEEGSEVEAARLAEDFVANALCDEELLRCAARVLSRLGRETAVEAWEKLDSLAGLKTSELFEAVRLARATGRLAAASSFLDRLLARVPAHAGAWQERVRLLLQASARTPERLLAATAALFDLAPRVALELLPEFVAGGHWSAILVLLSVHPGTP